MKAKEGVVNVLNKILTADLTAINQYFVHAKMCENWGYERLHHKVRERSVAEMKDADELIGHILYLDGVPNVQRMNTVQVGETVLEQLKLDLKAEQEMLALLSDGVVHCTKVTDFTRSRTTWRNRSRKSRKASPPCIPNSSRPRLSSESKPGSLWRKRRPPPAEWEGAHSVAGVSCTGWLLLLSLISPVDSPRSAI